MRDLVHDAVADAREVVGELVREGREANVLTDDEVLAEYEPMRGDLLAMTKFARGRVGPGGDVLGEAVRYEREMEKLWRQRAGTTA